MFDAAFLETCADPNVKTEIVERFVAAVGSKNPLAITITSGNRNILPEPPKTPDEAARLAQRFVGDADVRAGVTAFPVGVGISDSCEISPDLFDACKNIRMGTALFGKVYRVVAHARDVEDGAVLRDALEAWRIGQFEGVYVFAAPDPGRRQDDVEGQLGANSEADATPREAASSPMPNMVNPNAAHHDDDALGQADILDA